MNIDELIIEIHRTACLVCLMDIDGLHPRSATGSVLRRLGLKITGLTIKTCQLLHAVAKTNLTGQWLDRESEKEQNLVPGHGGIRRLKRFTVHNINDQESNLSALVSTRIVYRLSFCCSKVILWNIRQHPD